MRGKSIEKLPETVSHYEIGKIILNDLGVELVNPNEKARQYYLHGNNIDYPYDYIKYNISDDGNAVPLSTGNTGTDALKTKD